MVYFCLDMKLFRSFFEGKQNTDVLFEQQKGKTLAEYQQDSLVKMARRQFQKLQDLGLSIPVELA